jgi:hypothetical protein
VDRAKRGSRHHLAVDAGGVPLACTLTGANAHDVTQLIPLVDAIPPVRGRPGAPLRRPKCVMGDRGDDSDPHRMTLSGRGIRTRIARRGGPHGSGLGVLRYVVVEQTIALFHQMRRPRVRYDCRDDVHEAFMKQACILICHTRLRNSLF